MAKEREERAMSDLKLQMEEQAAAQREAAKLLAEADARRGNKPRPQAWRHPVARDIYNDAYTRERERVLSPASDPTPSEPQADADQRDHGDETAEWTGKVLRPRFGDAFEAHPSDGDEPAPPKAMTLPVLTETIHAHRTEEARRMSRIEAARAADARALNRCTQRLMLTERAVQELRKWVGMPDDAAERKDLWSIAEMVGALFLHRGSGSVPLKMRRRRKKRK